MKKITLFLVGIALVFSGFSQVPLYTYDFESGPGGWVLGGTISTWALGAPAAPIINSAASGANAFVTNLTGNYIADENGTVTSPSIDISTATGNEVLKLNIWYDAENSWDGANVFASYDGGTTWNIVGANGDPNNWYNDGSINGAPNGSQVGWTGTGTGGSNAWVLAEHTLDSTMLVNNTSLMLRVGFGSDGSVTDEGFAFDDVFVGENLQNDAGIVGFPSLVGASTGLLAITATIENFGTFPLTAANIDWSVNGVLQAAPLPFAGSIAPGATDTVNLGNFNIASGTTIFKAWTSLPNGVADLGNANDTTEFLFCTPLAGTFTLGGVGADFATFADLSNLLNTCGINGPVIVNVNPGTYTGRLILDHVSGTSMANTITIDGGNASLVTLSNTTFSNVYFNGTSWTTVQNMTLENTGIIDAYGVQLRDSAMNNTIDNCIINLNTTALNLQDVTGVNSSDIETIDSQEGQNAFWTTVSNCQINGGEQGVHFEGQGASRNVGNSCINNTFNLQEDIGIFVDDQDSLKIIGNTITNLRSVFADGMDLEDIMMFDISSNKIVDAPDIGIDIDDANFDAVPTSRGRISNNMISAGVDCAIGLDDIEETDVWHNSFANQGGTNAAFVMNDFTLMDIRNNIFYSDTDFAFDASDAIVVANNVIDFNSYWSNGPNLIDDGFTVSADLVAWQTAQPLINVGSIETDPLFVSYLSDLHVTSPLIDDLGDNTVGILVDIDGDVRPASPSTIVDMGADEFTAPPVDAGIVSIDNLTNPITAGIQSIDVTIRNFGALNLTSANIEWSANGVAQAPFSWTGNLTALATDMPTIGAYNFPPGVTEICAWSVIPNAMVDPNNVNDTACVTFCTPLNGIYTLGGVGADFATFTELGELLSNCGVNAAVTVNINPGTYTGRLILDHVPGASMVNTITINGGDASLVTLSNSTFSNVFLNGTDWTTIKNMTLENTGINDAYGVQLRDSAMNNTIDSCIINLETVVTNLADVTGVNASDIETSDSQEGQNAFWTTISNNQINGGEQGIHFEGQGASRNVGNRFINNTIDLTEDLGIFVDDQDSLTITGNTITNMRSGFADGMQLNDIMMFDVSYNTIVNVPDLGLSIADGNFDAVPTSRGRISNNMISSGVDYGITLDDIEETDVWHNSVANQGGTNAAFRMNDFTLMDIRNNIFYSETDFAFDATDAINVTNNVIDFNSYWSNGANLIDDGFTVSADLTAWQTAQPLINASSIETDPAFLSVTTDLHVFSSSVNDLGDNTVGIMDDIDGDVRPAFPSTFVDMGADEFTPLNNNAMFSAYLEPVSGLCGDSLTEVIVEVRNLGITTITVMNVNVEITGDAIVSLPFIYTGSLGFNERDTITLGTFNSYSGSNYTLDGYVNLTGEEDTSNDSLSISIDVIPFEPQGTDAISCNGDTAVISALSIPGVTYLWYDALVGGTQVGSSNTFTVPSTSAQLTYFVEYSNLGACSSIRTPVTVTLDVTATAAFTSTTTGMVVDFDATTTVGADSVLFDFGDGNTSTSLTPSNTYATSAAYTVCLYAYSFCGIDTVCQTVDITVGVEELSATAAVKVFPNPNKGQFVLDLAKYKQEELNVSVLNQLGKVIFNKTYSNNDNVTQQAIDLSAYSNGIYFLKLTSDEDVTTKKIIIQK